jgi:MFS family permease
VGKQFKLIAMQTSRQLPRNVWILGIVSLLNDISSEMIHSLLPLFLVSVLGARATTVGAIEGIAESTAATLKLFSGAFSDALAQRKGLTILGYGLSNLMRPLFALATSPFLVLIARFGDRVGKGIRVAPRDALIADSTPESQWGAAFGLRQSLDTLGAVIGPLTAFGVMVASGQNFRLVFILASIPGLFSILVLFFGIKEVRGRQKLGTKWEWIALKRLEQPFWLLMAIAFLFNLGNSSDAFLLLRAQQVGVPPAYVPLTMVVMNLVGTLSAYPVGWVSDRIGRLGLLASGFALYALIYLGFAEVQSVWQVWGLFIFYGLYQGLTQGILSALVADRVEPSLRGTAFGILNFGTGIALLPASLIAGWLWQQFNSRATFLFGSLCAALSLSLLLLDPMIWRKKPSIGSK